ncbi:hypothetical protein Bbelb_026710 [Branchiostoma belcheri]|nr:hypothetical protein Bbelb_026710 [Branchiostoma belcheri]
MSTLDDDQPRSPDSGDVTSGNLRHLKDRRHQAALQARLDGTIHAPLLFPDDVFNGPCAAGSLRLCSGTHTDAGVSYRSFNSSLESSPVSFGQLPKIHYWLDPDENETDVDLIITGNEDADEDLLEGDILDDTKV